MYTIVYFFKQIQTKLENVLGVYTVYNKQYNLYDSMPL